MQMDNCKMMYDIVLLRKIFVQNVRISKKRGEDHEKKKYESVQFAFGS